MTPCVALLAALAASAPASYDVLLAQAIAAGRAGRVADAEHALDLAIAADPGRPEALVERGGIRFLQRRYDEAAVELGRALRIREDPYTRELLGSALLLAGRGEEALEAWNPLGRPVLHAVEVHGVRHTRPRLVARETEPLREGELLEAGDVAAARNRLRATGLFDPVTIRPHAAAQDRVDLEVAVGERHGLGSPLELAARGVVDLTRERVRLRYANVAGAGITVSADYKWERTQPRVAAGFEFVRPFGLPAHVEVEAQRARPTYDLQDPFGILTLRTRGGDVRLRRAVGAGTVVAVGVHYRRRTFDAVRPDAPPGTIIGWQGRVSHVLAERPRRRAEAFADLLAAPGALGSDVEFATALLGVRGTRDLQDGPLPRALAAQVQFGVGTGGTPLDEMFSPGAASEMPLPLRAHRQKRGGVLGRAPIGRSLLLVNAEWRQRLLRRGAHALGAVLFYDGARVGRTARGETDTLHDAGVGLRLSLGGGTVLRTDFAHGLVDGKDSLTAGIGQVF